MKIVIFCFYALVLLGIVVAFIKVAFGGKSKPSIKNVRNNELIKKELSGSFFFYFKIEY